MTPIGLLPRQETRSLRAPGPRQRSQTPPTPAIPHAVPIGRAYPRRRIFSNRFPPPASPLAGLTQRSSPRRADEHTAAARRHTRPAPHRPTLRQPHPAGQPSRPAARPPRTGTPTLTRSFPLCSPLRALRSGADWFRPLASTTPRLRSMALHYASGARLHPTRPGPQLTLGRTYKQPLNTEQATTVKDLNTYTGLIDTKSYKYSSIPGRWPFTPTPPLAAPRRGGGLGPPHAPPPRLSIGGTAHALARHAATRGPRVFVSPGAL